MPIFSRAISQLCRQMGRRWGGGLEKTAEGEGIGEEMAMIDLKSPQKEKVHGKCENIEVFF